LNAPALVSIRGASKKYPRVNQPMDRIRGLLSALGGRRQAGGDAVLKPIDLTVYPGQSVAIIGENGAGKSTLLKLIAGVLRPSTGAVQIHARIGALLEVGAGFQPEETGLHNTRMAATLLGAKPGELKRLLPEIVAFADIGAAIDEPVKHYSSGMKVRLGFAIIAAMRPELLITDEVLAVGDEAFQRKCIQWLEGYLQQGGTLLLVSHNLFQVQKLCRHACWLRDGKVQRQGDVFEVCQAYLAYHQQRLDRRLESGSAPGSTRVKSLKLSTEGQPGNDLLLAGQRLVLDFELHGAPTSQGVRLGLFGLDGNQVLDSWHPLRSGCGNTHQLLLDTRKLIPGRYQLEVAAAGSASGKAGPSARRLLEVNGPTREFGSVRLPLDWSGSKSTRHD
jgi:lipopolysaccharide transport system ATP-binding protein